jgi:hypothetical protein
MIEVEKKMKKVFGVWLGVVCGGLLVGCATTTLPVSFLYAPSKSVGGGTGDVFLKTSTAEAPANGSNDIRFVVGHQKNSDGAVTGEIVSRYSAEDMVLDALNRELSVAGYSVRTGTAMPPDVHKGLSLKSAQVEVEESGIIPKSDVTATVRVSLDVWKDGEKVKTLTYESHSSDVAIINNRSRAASEVVEKGLHAIMAQATPDLIAVFDPKPIH